MNFYNIINVLLHHPRYKRGRVGKALDKVPDLIEKTKPESTEGESKPKPTQKQRKISASF